MNEGKHEYEFFYLDEKGEPHNDGMFDSIIHAGDVRRGLIPPLTFTPEQQAVRDRIRAKHRDKHLQQRKAKK